MFVVEKHKKILTISNYISSGEAFIGHHFFGVAITEQIKQKWSLEFCY